MGWDSGGGRGANEWAGLGLGLGLAAAAEAGARVALVLAAAAADAEGVTALPSLARYECNQNRIAHIEQQRERVENAQTNLLCLSSRQRVFVE